MLSAQFNLCYYTSRLRSFLSGHPSVPSRRVSRKSLYVNDVPLKEFRVFQYSAVDYHRFQWTCADRCRAAKRKRVHRQREAGSRATVNRFSMPLKNAPPSAVIILIDTQARPRRPAVPLAYTLSRSRVHSRDVEDMRLRGPTGPSLTRHTLWPGWKENARECAPTTFGDRRGRIPRRARACMTAGDTRSFSWNTATTELNQTSVRYSDVTMT